MSEYAVGQQVQFDAVDATPAELALRQSRTSLPLHTPRCAHTCPASSPPSRHALPSASTRYCMAVRIRMCWASPSCLYPHDSTRIVNRLGGFRPASAAFHAARSQHLRRAATTRLVRAHVWSACLARHAMASCLSVVVDCAAAAVVHELGFARGARLFTRCHRGWTRPVPTASSSCCCNSKTSPTTWLAQS